MKTEAIVGPKQYITAQGKAELKKRLATFKRERAQLLEEMRELMSQNGTSIGIEDSLQALHKERADDLDARIYNIENIIRTAMVITPPASNDTVQIGSRVIVEMDGKRRTYSIVGTIEADPILGKISHESPVGIALLGRQVYDSVEIMRLPRKTIVAKIIAIK